MGASCCSSVRTASSVPSRIHVEPSARTCGNGLQCKLFTNDMRKIRRGTSWYYGTELCVGASPMASAIAASTAPLQPSKRAQWLFQDIARYFKIDKWKRTSVSWLSWQNSVVLRFCFPLSSPKTGQEIPWIHSCSLKSGSQLKVSFAFGSSLPLITFESFRRSFVSWPSVLLQNVECMKNGWKWYSCLTTHVSSVHPTEVRGLYFDRETMQRIPSPVFFHSRLQHVHLRATLCLPLILASISPSKQVELGWIRPWLD